VFSIAASLSARRRLTAGLVGAFVIAFGGDGWAQEAPQSPAGAAAEAPESATTAPQANETAPPGWLRSVMFDAGMTVDPFIYRDAVLGFGMGIAFGGRGFYVGFGGGAGSSGDMPLLRDGAPISVSTSWMAFNVTWEPSWFFVSGRMGRCTVDYVPMRDRTHNAEDVETEREKRSHLFGIRTGLIIPMYRYNEAVRKVKMTARPFVEASGPSFPLEMRLGGKPFFARDPFSSRLNVSFGLVVGLSFGELDH